MAQGPEDGWQATPIVAALVLAVVFLIAFALIESRSRDPLMPVRLFGNRSLVAGMAITFIYMGTFGALPYFLTVLFQSVQDYSTLQTGPAFIVPSLAIFAGTQLGARLANRLPMRRTLVIGFVVSIVGTLALAPAAFLGAPYTAIVPGLVVSGIGQGIVWTAMWSAAASGVAHHGQGIASGMASTTLSVGNAIGIAVLVAFANRGIGGLQGEALREGLATGLQHAFYLAAAGLLLGLLVSLTFSSKASANVQAGAA
ncbi:TPA: MFS transporter [Pseudomonas aeruginosa]|uniref:MFS transporter n=1 Tax=Pseudomonas aeruginosa TaxID=287 RepID=UPI0021E928A5|nr:MFS transporter [Pseudomonas aeruginosa]MCV3902997.1 MFS transporter [Pseudomonas aeruginosa]HBN9664616.1 MFS transporter [Pseudomonas aeruginosa]HCE6886256.1 MFS transporter [Pseudomonas aeruginosa]